MNNIIHFPARRIEVEIDDNDVFTKPTKEAIAFIKNKLYEAGMPKTDCGEITKIRNWDRCSCIYVWKA